VTQFFRSRFTLSRPSVFAVILAATLAAALCPLLRAQANKTITILMLDGKTGRPIIPSNFVVRIDHLDAIHNEWLKLTDDGLGIVIVPPSASFLSVQGTYESSMEIYINCDASMQKDTSTLHWYSIADILDSGVAMPNECYKGKYAEATHVTPKPGQFVMFVRKTSWHEMPADY
jgi:hypothetical protein